MDNYLVEVVVNSHEEIKRNGGLSAFSVYRQVKTYFMIDQQITRVFVHYSESLSNPLNLLWNTNNLPLS